MTPFFDEKYMAVVERQQFRLNVRGQKIKRGRPVIVVSTHGLSESERADLRARYLENFSSGFVSFPLKERAKHLMTRIDSRVFNFGRAVVNWLPRFRRKNFALPRSTSLEVMVKLEPAEAERLRIYLANIIRDRARTIGKFTMAGHQFTRGALDGNATLEGGHNCSSWIATAPLGDAGEPLIELLGGDRNLEVGTNPGWWSSWLSATASDERVPFLLHWSTEPLATVVARLRPGHNFPWDFNRH